MGQLIVGSNKSAKIPWTFHCKTYLWYQSSFQQCHLIFFNVHNIFRSDHFWFKCYILTFEDWLAICFTLRFDLLSFTCSTFTFGSYPFIWCAFRFIYCFLNQTKKSYFCSTFTLWSCPFIQCTFKYVLC